MHTVFGHLEKVLGVLEKDLTAPVKAIISRLDAVNDQLVHDSSPALTTEIHPDICDHLVLNKISSAVYSDDALSYREYETWYPLADNIRLVGHVEDIMGFDAAVYRVEHGTHNHHVLAFRGTVPSDPRNLLTDAVNALGLPSLSYDDAIHKASLAIKVFPQILFTGHSLGGGLAQYAALCLGVKAVTFNAADVACHLLEGKVDPGLLNYRHVNDPISAANRLTGKLGMTCPMGKQIIIDGPETELNAHALEALRAPILKQCVDISDV